jgi:transposase InsO family protein
MAMGVRGRQQAVRAMLGQMSRAPPAPQTRDNANAMMEAFWSRMQVELLDSRSWKTRVELANAIFEYLEVFHNRRRRHSSLGMLTPIEFELNNINTTTQAA